MAPVPRREFAKTAGGVPHAGAESRASSTPNPTRTIFYRCGALRMSAKELAGAVYGRRLDHKAEGDFVGMEVARKYLQMDYTRARRCVRYRGGNKKKPLEVHDPEKSRAAEIFYERW